MANQQSVTTPPRAVLVDIYRKMTLAKQNDERVRAVLRSGRLITPYYSTRGQEVIPAAVSVNLRTDDYVCTIYRAFMTRSARACRSNNSGLNWPAG
jgi:TPP-dependent pyruvate/acetoin dehydrogenase alpha subunit